MAGACVPGQQGCASTGGRQLMRWLQPQCVSRSVRKLAAHSCLLLHPCLLCSGFQLLSGVPVEQWTQEQAILAYWVRVGCVVPCCAVRVWVREQGMRAAAIVCTANTSSVRIVTLSPGWPQGMGLYWGQVRPINKQGHLLGHIKVGGWVGAGG